MTNIDAIADRLLAGKELARLPVDFKHAAVPSTFPIALIHLATGAFDDEMRDIAKQEGEIVNRHELDRMAATFPVTLRDRLAVLMYAQAMTISVDVAVKEYRGSVALVLYDLKSCIHHVLGPGSTEHDEWLTDSILYGTAKPLVLADSEACSLDDDGELLREMQRRINVDCLRKMNEWMGGDDN